MADFIYQFFLSIGLLSFISLLGGLFSAKLRQPAVMGLILIGVIVGPNVLGIVNDNQIIELLAELGATLLLFSIGVEFSISKLVGQGARAIFAATIIMAALFITGYEAAVILGLDFLSSLAIGACFSFSSTAIFIRLMQANNLLSSAQAPFLISVLVIEDIVAVFAIAFFAAIETESSSGKLGSIAISLLFSLAIMGFAYIILNKIISKFVHMFSRSISDEQIMLLSLGLALVMAFFSTAIGLSAAVGAFIAGSILSNLDIKQRIQAIISPLILAFSSYFFISIGLFVSPTALLSSLPILLVLCALFIAVSFGATAISAYLAGFRSSDAVAAGASMIVMGEFSLLIAREIAPAIKGFDLISTLAAMVFITAFFSSIFLAKRRTITSILHSSIPYHIRKLGASLRGYIYLIISRLESNSSCTIKAKKSFLSIARSVTIFTIVAFAALFIRSYFLSHFTEYGYILQIISLFPLISLVIVIPLFISILFELKRFADSLSEFFMPQGIRQAKGLTAKVTSHISLFLIFALIFLTIPALVQLMRLPQFFSMINAIPLLAMLLILYNGINQLSPSISSKILKNNKIH